MTAAMATNSVSTTMLLGTPTTIASTLGTPTTIVSTPVTTTGIVTASMRSNQTEVS